MFAGETESMSEVKDLENRWPIMSRVLSYAVLGLCGWAIAYAIIGWTTGGLPWPFSLSPIMTYEEYVKQQEFANRSVTTLISILLGFAGVWVLASMLLRRIRRVLNTQKKEVNKQV